ncbi:MAG: hypothetical protein JXR95_04115 [Deltaproteobacteria bacterium]|nr:hypothetical protein [Deltaproteobacteria bacterium]
MTEKILYSETQQVSSFWKYFTCLLISIPVIVFTYIVLNRYDGNFITGWKTTDIILWLVTVFFASGIVFLVFITKLQIELTSSVLSFKYVPLMLKWKYREVENIHKWEIIKFRPVVQYGGWGMRLGRDHIAYIMRGNAGIFFIFKNKEKLMIGTKNPELFSSKLREITKEGSELLSHKDDEKHFRPLP